MSSINHSHFSHSSPLNISTHAEQYTLRPDSPPHYSSSQSPSLLSSAAKVNRYRQPLFNEAKANFLSTLRLDTEVKGTRRKQQAVIKTSDREYNISLLLNGKKKNFKLNQNEWNEVANQIALILGITVKDLNKRSNFSIDQNGIQADDSFIAHTKEGSNDSAQAFKDLEIYLKAKRAPHSPNSSTQTSPKGSPKVASRSQRKNSDPNRSGSRPSSPQSSSSISHGHSKEQLPHSGRVYSPPASPIETLSRSNTEIPPISPPVTAVHYHVHNHWPNSDQNHSTSTLASPTPTPEAFRSENSNESSERSVARTFSHPSRAHHSQSLIEAAKKFCSVLMALAQTRASTPSMNSRKLLEYMPPTTDATANSSLVPTISIPPLTSLSLLTQRPEQFRQSPIVINNWASLLDPPLRILVTSNKSTQHRTNHKATVNPDSSKAQANAISVEQQVEPVVTDLSIAHPYSSLISRKASIQTSHHSTQQSFITNLAASYSYQSFLMQNVFHQLNDLNKTAKNTFNPKITQNEMTPFSLSNTLHQLKKVTKHDIKRQIAVAIENLATLGRQHTIVNPKYPLALDLPSKAPTTAQVSFRPSNDLIPITLEEQPSSYALTIQSTSANTSNSGQHRFTTNWFLPLFTTSTPSSSKLQSEQAIRPQDFFVRTGNTSVSQRLLIQNDGNNASIQSLLKNNSHLKSQRLLFLKPTGEIQHTTLADLEQLVGKLSTIQFYDQKQSSYLQQALLQNRSEQFQRHAKDWKPFAAIWGSNTLQAPLILFTNSKNELAALYAETEATSSLKQQKTAPLSLTSLSTNTTAQVQSIGTSVITESTATTQEPLSLTATPSVTTQSKHVSIIPDSSLKTVSNETSESPRSVSTYSYEWDNPNNIPPSIAQRLNKLPLRNETNFEAPRDRRSQKYKQLSEASDSDLLPYLQNGNYYIQYRNGEVVKGTFENGHLIQGSKTYPNGNKLEGRFEFDQLVQGSFREYVTPICKSATGHFVNGKLVEGTLKYEINGHVKRIYKGTFNETRFTGQLFDSKGCFYEGTFAIDQSMHWDPRQDYKEAHLKFDLISDKTADKVRINIETETANPIDKPLIGPGTIRVQGVTYEGNFINNRLDGLVKITMTLNGEKTIECRFIRGEYDDGPIEHTLNLSHPDTENVMRTFETLLKKGQPYLEPLVDSYSTTSCNNRQSSPVCVDFQVKTILHRLEEIQAEFVDYETHLIPRKITFDDQNDYQDEDPEIDSILKESINDPFFQEPHKVIGRIRRSLNQLKRNLETLHRLHPPTYSQDPHPMSESIMRQFNVLIKEIAELSISQNLSPRDLLSSSPSISPRSSPEPIHQFDDFNFEKILKQLQEMRIHFLGYLASDYSHQDESLTQTERSALPTPVAMTNSASSSSLKMPRPIPLLSSHGITISSITPSRPTPLPSLIPSSHIATSSPKIKGVSFKQPNISNLTKLTRSEPITTAPPSRPALNKQIRTIEECRQHFFIDPLSDSTPNTTETSISTPLSTSSTSELPPPPSLPSVATQQKTSKVQSLANRYQRQIDRENRERDSKRIAERSTLSSTAHHQSPSMLAKIQGFSHPSSSSPQQKKEASSTPTSHTPHVKDIAQKFEKQEGNTKSI